MSAVNQVWWREDPLSEQERNLMEAVLVAHHNSSYRDNPSTAAVLQAAYASGDLGNAICSGILTTGGKHAPIEQTCWFLLLEQPDYVVPRILKKGDKVPGWGGAFQKDQPDPIWNETAKALREVHPELSQKIEDVTAELFRHGKKVHPNPSAYTAAAAIALRLAPQLAFYLFIMGRLSAWSQIAAQNIQRKKEQLIWVSQQQQQRQP